MEVRAINNQSLFDIAIQEYGTVEAAFDIAVFNEMDVTDNLVPGQILKLPNSEYERKEIVSYFRSRNLHPATGFPLLSEEDTEEWFGALPGMLNLLLS